MQREIEADRERIEACIGAIQGPYVARPAPQWLVERYFHTVDGGVP
jgi:hypothetical protein